MRIVRQNLVRENAVRENVVRESVVRDQDVLCDQRCPPSERFACTWTACPPARALTPRALPDCALLPRPWRRLPMRVRANPYFFQPYACCTMAAFNTL
jgi:hypothetical protein